MTVTENLKKKVRELETETDRQKQIEMLQQIGIFILEKCALKIAGITIQPLWMEAYYHNKQNGFIDPFVHMKEAQKEFGKLYFHHETDDPRSGVDLVLSQGDYCLSYLLKYTLVDGIYTTQGQLSKKIRSAYFDLNDGEQERIIVKSTDMPKMIARTKRVGLKVGGEDNGEDRDLRQEYVDLPLAIARDVCQKYRAEKCLPQKENLVRDYLKHRQDLRIEEKAKWCSENLGYCLKDYKE